MLCYAIHNSDPHQTLVTLGDVKGDIPQNAVEDLEVVKGYKR